MLDLRILQIALLSFIPLCSCISADSEPEVMKVPFETITKAGFSGIQVSTNQVIKTEEQWSTFWKQHSVISDVEKPDIDFEESMVIVAAAGQKRSAGYAIEIVRVARKEKILEIHIREKEPTPGGMTIQAMTAPIHTVKTAKSDLPAKFISDRENSETDE